MPGRPRARAIVAMVSAFAAGAVVAWGASALIVSPAEARPTPVPATEITAAVERRALTTQLGGSGTIVLPDGAPVIARLDGDGRAVVSGLPVEVGQPVPWCRPVVEISGRPLIALRGAVPAFRDLTRGDSGSDVVQLQTALEACGYDIADREGTFGWSTDRALRALYRDIGYEQPTVIIEPASTGPTQSTTTPGEEVTPTVVAATVQAVLPAAEVVVLPTDGVVQALAPLGSDVTTDPVAQVGPAGFVLRADLPVAMLSQLAAGQAVTLLVAGQEVATTLPEPPTAPVTDPDTGAAVYRIDIPLPGSVESSAAGSPATFQVTVGDPAVRGCVVPVSAVYLDGSGATFVVRAGGGDRVPVAVGAAVGGFVCVEPTDGTSLAIGDAVVVGVQR